MTPDSELLKSYAENASEDAFRVLVQRYTGLVYSAALRQTTSSGIAEEVTQAVFLLLAKKARSLDSRVVLAGWLLKTARFMAARARISEQRRHLREKEAMQMQDFKPADDETWKSLATLLDEGLCRLSEADRSLLVSRFIQGDNPSDVSARLGLSKEAAKKRQSRALEKLRKFFARRGLVLSAGVLGTMLGASLVQAAPEGLENRILMNIANTASTPAVAFLVEEAFRQLWLNKVKLAVGIEVAICLGLFTVSKTVGLTGRGTRQTSLTQGLVTSEATAGGTNNATAASVSNGPGIEVHVVDTLGAPIAAVKVRSLFWADWTENEPPILETDNNGLARVLLPPNVELGRVDIGFLKDGYQEKFLTWRTDKHGPLPKSYTIHLEPGARIGGIVLDEEGKPVPSARICVQFSGGGDASGREAKQERLGFVTSDWDVTTTDSMGRWNCAIVPNEAEDFVVLVHHPEFLKGGVAHNDEHLFAGEATTVLKKGIVANGMVMDEQDRPVPNARLKKALSSLEVVAASDSRGRFTLKPMEAGENVIIVSAPGFAPRSFQMEGARPDTWNIRLLKGRPLNIRVVDEAGLPLQKTRLQLEDRYLEWHAFTDADGRATWDAAPNKELEIYAHHTGYFQSRGTKFVPNGEEHTLVLKNELRVTGKVEDADTGEPIGNFLAIPGYPASGDRWYRSEQIHATNGVFALVFNEPYPAFDVRIEAEGYEPLVSSKIPFGVTETNLVLKLRKEEATDFIHGVVLLPDGRPAAGAEVALGTAENRMELGAGSFLKRGTTLLKIPDGQGRFMFKPERWAHTIVAVHPEGFARMRLKNVERPVKLQLQPWGKVEGRVLNLGDCDGQQVRIGDRATMQYRGGLNFDYETFAVPVGKDGSFQFMNVPPGRLTISRELKAGTFWSEESWIVVEPGKTTFVELGLALGTKIIGRLVPKEGLNGRMLSAIYTSFYQGLKGRPAPRGLSKEEEIMWEEEYWNSSAGLRELQESRNYHVELKPDGQFTVEGVLPGTYGFSIIVEVKRLEGERVISQEQQRFDQQIQITEQSGIMDLGEITLKR